GTNGKTSCSHFAAECLNQKYKSAVMGTIGNGIVGHLKQSSHTTLDIISINKMLNDFSKDDVKNVVMEVSSHGLDQGRVAELKFQTAVFTNLTRDHLDYHKTTENYAKCKLKLFAMKDLKNAVVNVDDPFSQTILDHLNHQINVIVYGIKWVKTDKNYVFARDITFEPNGMVVNFTSSWGDGVFNTKLLGDFNVSNLLAVLGILFCSGITVDKAINYIQSVNNVAGRMEKFTANNLPKVIVDYAHTPDALEKALKTLNSHCDGKIWCVFGCGGSRDQGKRKIMGAIAEQMCDQIVLTDDNPREEQSEKIIEDILLGMINKPMVIIKQDRRQAIEYAVTNADMNDFVLVAGKGHENYQEINGRRLPYSDREIVSNLGMLN
ncbi:MAG: UDP-N-acetylmuramoyl-L-alanyl-D-glutamate--2,6-diaminopimelate ligase, partial [Methylococcales bacterium]|nr:UDP-N-acetylmuramoyl-L-alanyl-D-glutamate--2,6-diaminopimelate ligase [Methylococcales bacterium]